MASTLVQELAAQITEARLAYYDGEPIMTDPEYDAIEAQLKAIDPKNDVFKKVGDSTNSGGRIPHARPMRSIENYYTEETFIAATKNYGDVLVLEPKQDGVSATLKYIDGVLVQALARSDGESGEDMTAQVKACTKIPQKINTNIHELHIRCELVMRNSELARINALGGKQYANTRNLTAGTMKQQDLSIVASREILALPWDMFSPDEDGLLPDSAFERMQLAAKLGFAAYEGEKVQKSDVGGIKVILQNILERNETSDITADGVVIKTDSHAKRNKLGVGSSYTFYQHCYKSQNQKGITYLREVIWTLGRTGRITPVGIVDPIVLGGATITRANLNNETWINALNLKINSKVEIIRSGDCIPVILSALDV